MTRLSDRDARLLSEILGRVGALRDRVSAAASEVGVGTAVLLNSVADRLDVIFLEVGNFQAGPIGTSRDIDPGPSVAGPLEVDLDAAENFSEPLPPPDPTVPLGWHEPPEEDGDEPPEREEPPEPVEAPEEPGDDEPVRIPAAPRDEEDS